MPESAFGPEVQAVFDAVNAVTTRSVSIDGALKTIVVPSPSPADWRDNWIYFLMVDRFNNERRPPESMGRIPSIAFDQEFAEFQGGTFEGIRKQLSYIRDLGAGAVWLSPVFKNCLYETGTFHGYGIQDFLHAEPRFSSDPGRARKDPSFADGELVRLIDEIHAREMFVVLDIVLNHSGNVFGYVVNGKENADSAEFRDHPYDIRWHDERKDPAFADIEKAPKPLHPEAGVWPSELQVNSRFRRQGKASDVPGAHGDFESLKQIVSEDRQVQDALIRSYQYAIARFDCDGFRIDTFKVPDKEFGHTFCASIREFALSIGKKNFFTFGEITVDEGGLRNFIGRDTKSPGADTIGIDSALDFALEGTLNAVVKHSDASKTSPPTILSGMYQSRKDVERTVITTHGEASGFFVTFIDNHDRHQRFFFRDSEQPDRWNHQLTLALSMLFTLQGIPCVYYGTEQGLHGIGDSDGAVREALWGKPNAFDQLHPFYERLQALAAVRAAQPALRYGRQYFRQISGDGKTFAVSTFTPGVISFSRILNAHEVVVVANTSDQVSFQGEVIIDSSINHEHDAIRILFSNMLGPIREPGPLRRANTGSISVSELDGSTGIGPALVLPVSLRPLEVQILRCHSVGK